MSGKNGNYFLKIIIAVIVSAASLLLVSCPNKIITPPAATGGYFDVDLVLIGSEDGAPYTEEISFTDASKSVTVEASYLLSTVAIELTEELEGADIHINGYSLTFGSKVNVDLETGTNRITVKVSPNLVESFNYTLNIKRGVAPGVTLSDDATLSSLEISNVPNSLLHPDFSADELDYFTSVGTTITEVILTAVTNDVNAEMSINAEAVTSGAASDPFSLDYGLNEAIEITVTAEDEITINTYTIEIFRSSVLDTEDPVITLIGGSPYYLEVHSHWEEPGYSAHDEVEGDLTSAVEITGSIDTSALGSQPLSYGVSDTSGNFVQELRSVIIEDTTDPVITLNGEDPMRVDQHAVFSDPGSSVSDNYDIGLSSTISGSVDTSVLGTYQLSYTAEDSSGNTSSEIRNVVVSNENDTDPPVITLSGDNPAVHEVNTVWSDPGYSAADGFDGNLTASVTISGTVNVSAIGSTTLYYDVSDSSGNAAIQQSRQVSVEDNTAPTIERIGDADITVAHGSSFADPGVIVTDNYDSGITPTVIGNVNMSTLGIYPLLYRAYDSEGNGPAEISRIVRVTDQTPPILSLVGGSSVTIALGSAFTDPITAGNLTASDNVDGDLTGEIDVTGDSVDTALPGIYIILFDVIDAAGLTADTVTYTVTVEDQEAPVITLAGNASITLEFGDAFSDPGADVVDNWDNGGTPWHITSPVAVDTNSVDTFILTYDATDTAGNTALQVTRTVEVQPPPDTINPVITLIGPAAVDVAWPAEYTDQGATASDYRNEDPIEYDITGDIVVTDNVNYSVLGNYTIDYDVTDLAGNTDSESRTVNIMDTSAPVIIISGNNPLTVDYGTTFTAPSAIANDNYDGALAPAGINVSGAAAVDTTDFGGTYLVIYTISDSSGNEDTETLTVNIGDLSPPILGIMGSNPATVECGDAYGSTEDVGAMAVDNRDGNLTGSIAVSGLPIGTDQPGSHTVYYDVSDAVGNAADTASRSINVVDTTPPVLTLLGEAAMSVVLYSDWAAQDPGVSISDNDVRTAGLTAVLSGLDMNTAGVQTLTYNLSDLSGNAAVPVTRSVTVMLPPDTINPEIELIGPAVVDLEYPGSYTDQWATATDQQNGDPTVYDISGSIVVTDNVNYSALGSYTIDYEVADAAGNTASISRTVNVVDTSGPVISITGSNPVTVECGETYGASEDAGATAIDNFDGDRTGFIVTSGLPISTDQPGSPEVDYNVSDSNGNAAVTASRSVNVVDTTAPVISLIGDAEITVAVHSDWASQDPGVTISDNDVRTVNLDPFVSGIDMNSTGAQTAVYSLSDLSGNAAATVQRTVNVVDEIVPVIDLGGISSMSVEYGTAFSDAAVTASDNYDGNLTGSIVVSGDTVNILILGDYTILYNVSDSSGNSATQQSRTVTVEDTTAPVVTILGDNPVIIECLTTYTDAGATAIDDRDGDLSSAIMTTGLPISTLLPGHHTVTYEVTDAEGNTESIDRNVHVVDTIAPTITLTAPLTLTAEVNTLWSAWEPGVSATDNVDGVISGDVISSGLNMSSLGTQILEYNVADSSGNDAATVSRTVTVVDTTAPVITLIGDAEITISVGSPFSDPGATVIDNYDSSRTIYGSGIVNRFAAGTYTLTYATSDNHSNVAAELERTVIVE